MEQIKVHKKGAQISVETKKIVTKWLSETMIMKYKQATHYICFFIFLPLCLFMLQIY